MARLSARDATGSYDESRIALDRTFGPLDLRIHASRLNERDTLLGARISSAFGAPNGVTSSVGFDGRLNLGPYALGGSIAHSRTAVGLNSGIEGSGRLTSSSWAFDAARYGLFHGGDILAFQISQPLRVATGGIDLSLPIAYDHFTGIVTDYQSQHLSLAPKGREIDLETSYSIILPHGSVSFNAFTRRQPNNIAAAPSDHGAALRASLKF